MSAPMSPAMRARLIAASDYVLTAHEDGRNPHVVIHGLIRRFGARYKCGPRGNTLRCAGITASCTWSHGRGLLNTWRRLATIELAMEAHS